MLTLRKSSDRGHFDFGWLDTKHTFSFGHYVDRNWMGFRSLRVINEDLIAPGKGFGEHPHDNMEIISYMAAGSLAHRDTLGSVQSISPGEVQRMSAGTGLEHSEFNPSATEPAHLLQIWIKPAQRGVRPGYDQKKFPIAEEPNRLHELVSPDGRNGSLIINQDARLFASKLTKGTSIPYDFGAGRYGWVQVIKGTVQVRDGGTLQATLGPGDAAGLSDQSHVDLKASEEAELLFFDLA